MIELIVVIMIVVALAGVSIPMMTGNLKRARATEAISTLGAIRTQMRLILAETDSMLDKPGTTDDFSGVTKVAGMVPGFPNEASLEGTYFPGANYTIIVTDATHFVASVTGSAAKKTSGVKISIDETGAITEVYNYVAPAP